MPDIPDYYRQFAQQPRPAPPPPQQQQQAQRPPPPPAAAPPTVPFRANRFVLDLYEDWQDKTVYVLAGPATDDVQHNVTITASPDVDAESLLDYADWQMKGLEENLKGCRLLKKEPIQLACGLPAYRAIFVWYPTEDMRLYQEQLYVLHEKMGYTLTASFTKKTRKTLGPQVQRIMLGFNPAPPAPPTPPAPPQRQPPRRF